MKIFLFFFGPPASGKGTQIELLTAKTDFKVLSVGKLLRKKESDHTKEGQALRKLLDSGKLVPNKIVEVILDDQLYIIKDKARIVFDGYPRNEKQLKLLDKRFKKIAKAGDKILAIFIDLSVAEVKRRLGGRRCCTCGEIYHVEFNPPKKDSLCDQCGKKLFIREDDNYSVIIERLKIYHKEFHPILNYWKDKDQLIKIDGDQSIKKVHQDIVKSLKNNSVL
ncbi:MAG: nucleoside monophosphate kinase [Candidatus Falkowbacteria bacterium]|nr:nucleoside monophosphate kinase [Candidatus Falkowbacteria bacterium]